MSSTSKLGGLNFPQLFFLPHQYSLVGGFNPSEKYKSQLGLLFPIYGKIKHVPNHQPVLICLKQWGWNKKTCSETFESLVILSMFM